MHNQYYASGFLYHPLSGKILLQQSPENNNTSVWSMFTGHCDNNGHRHSYCTVIYEQLKTDMRPEAVFPVYDYNRPEARECHFIFYAVVSHDDLKLKPRRGFEIRWFTAKEISKLELLPQVRHDITIGMRVIGAAERENSAV
ncbi:hypothetical protein A2Z33_06075 [Candidatus Gottesmanbacteria bacterium RBG_16_52_11]|uniref:Nudix hydrolase domain-containing protein n=1 Tax=Candidatus Gottesmanbacteria bacterium RBG_16_52_11 TaxID=1798374 RepID=A0A1F5YXI5_9BACT|nr:MAG: hypothetical protein A2Z33_06075 [Candidatus Gottesmanbacteria bacterium RBG_16_52_11]